MDLSPHALLETRTRRQGAAAHMGKVLGTTHRRFVSASDLDRLAKAAGLRALTTRTPFALLRRRFVSPPLVRPFELSRMGGELLQAPKKSQAGTQ